VAELLGVTLELLLDAGKTRIELLDRAKIEELLENPMIEELLNIIPGKELLLRNWPANGSMEEELGVA
jgi:hypothetical protein